MSRQYRSVHQTVSLLLDFDTQTIVGETEIFLVPLQASLSFVALNGDNIQVSEVLINDLPAVHEFEFVKEHQVWHTDAWEGTARGIEYCRSLKLYELYLHEEQDIHRSGNLLAFIPTEIRQEMMNTILSDPDDNFHPLKVTVRYSVKQPKTGLVFIESADGGCKQAYSYTHEGQGFASSWLPCIDNLHERNTYDIKVTVPKDIVVIASGKKQAITDINEGFSKPHHTYYYKCDIPIPASSLGIVCGPFYESKSKSTPGLTNYFVLNDHKKSSKHTQLRNIEHISGRLSVAQNIYSDYVGVAVFKEYSQVFIDEVYVQEGCFAGLSTFSSSLLINESQIDATYANRKTIALSYMRSQLYSTLLIEAYSDNWFRNGLCCYLVYLFIQKTFGRNEAHYQRLQDVEYVCRVTDLEKTHDKDNHNHKEKEKLPPDHPNNDNQQSHHTKKQHQHHLQLARPLYWLGYLDPIELYDEFFTKKSLVVISMLLHLLGRQNFRIMIKKLVNESIDYIDRHDGALPLSTNTLFKIAREISLEQNIDIFKTQWILSESIPKLTALVKFSGNRGKTSKNQLDVKITQKTAKGNNFSGPISFVVHEINRSMQYVYRLDDSKNDFKFPIISTQKRKKMGNAEDENVDVDLLLDKHTSLIRWITVDPQLQWLRPIKIELRKQDAYIFIHQLRSDTSVISQIGALKNLHKILAHYFDRDDKEGKSEADLQRKQSLLSLIYACFYELLSDPCVFSRVRIELIKIMAKLSVRPNVGPIFYKIISKFVKEEYFDGQTLKRNDFSLISNYFIKCNLPLILSEILGTDRYTDPNTVNLILALLQKNENKGNIYSDNIYVSNLIKSLGNVRLSTTETIEPIFDELERQFKYDQANPSYENIISQAVLYASCSLEISEQIYQRIDYINYITGDYRHHFHPKVCFMAFTCMIRLSITKQRMRYIPLILDTIRKEKNIKLKQEMLQYWNTFLYNNLNKLHHFRINDTCNILLLNTLWPMMISEHNYYSKVLFRHILQCFVGLTLPVYSTTEQKRVTKALHAYYKPLCDNVKKSTSRTRKRICKSDREKIERQKADSNSNVMIFLAPDKTGAHKLAKKVNMPLNIL